MRRAIFLMAAVALLLLQRPQLCLAQTATDPNAGSKLEWDATNSIWRFKWWAKQGNTYFLQHTNDLMQPWTWIPVVESGDDSIKEWGFTSTSDKFFLRLRYTDASIADPEGGDFDNDGISNLAEVQQGTDPFAKDGPDTDGDGLTDLRESQLGSDPRDYYSQGTTTITPVLEIVSGNNQTGGSALFVTDPFVVKVTNGINGPILPNAPVDFTVTQGNGRLASGIEGSSALFTSMQRISDPVTGRVQAFYKMPSTFRTISKVTVTPHSGVPLQFASVVFTATAEPNGLMPEAPTDVNCTRLSSTSILVEWKDNSNNEMSFYVERSRNNQSWTRIATLPMDSTSYTDEGLPSGVIYSYRILAHNETP